MYIDKFRKKTHFLRKTGKTGKIGKMKKKKKRKKKMNEKKRKEGLIRYSPETAQKKK